ncbi:MAG: DUF3619 family protein [Giesbergeria sp.]
MKNLPASSTDLVLDRIAHRIAARLDEGLADLPHEVTEPLRAARMQALAVRKKPQTMVVRKPASVLTRLGNSLAFGGGGGSGDWGYALMSAIPVLALVAGVVFMGAMQDETGASEIAEVDVALLIDDLPPAAYADPGFVQYLKTRANESH